MADSKKYNGSTWEHSLRKLATATDTFTTLPVDVYADGNNATVGLKGNTVQNGTPSPSNPVDVVGVGERTENLLDIEAATDSAYINSLGEITYNDAWSVSDYISVESLATYTISRITDQASTAACHAFYDANKSLISTIQAEVSTQTFETPTNAKYIRCSWRSATIQQVMLNSGSTAKPYEPYGYKIPILSTGQTTPVYLGEVETTRKIKKLVLTGEETSSYSTDYGVFYMQGLITDYLKQGKICVCSHFQPQNNVSSIGAVQDGVSFHGGDTANRIYFKNPSFASKNEWVQFLAAQYAAGTPVVVWYVLNAPETAVVNEPLMKIGEYADTVSGITIPTITGADSFDVLTALKPSEVSLSYTGWHDATVGEWDGSQWNR